MNNFDPTRMVPAPAMPGADLTAFFAAVQSQTQLQGLPQMPMPIHAGMPGVQQWQGQFWPQQQQQQRWIPGPGPGAGPQLQAAPQPSTANLQNMLAAAYQVWVQQQQQQQQPQLYPPPPPQPPQFPPPAQQQHTQLSSPVGSMIDDEARLIEALKGCKSKGLTPRQALEELHGVNNHSASDWRDYFLDHLERLYAHVKPPTAERRVSASNGLSSKSGSSSISTSERLTNAPQRHRPHESYNTQSHHSKEWSRHRAEPRLPEPATIPRSHGRRPSLPPRRGDEGDSSSFRSRSPARPSEPPAPISGSRRTRGEPVPDFHAGTRIPHTEGRMRPEPPLLEDAGEGGKFTPADHCFFIHYLRWRLAKDPLVARDTLYEELAEQTPSHDADAWRRHWDNDPQLPDRVVIEAGKRAVAARTSQREDSSLPHTDAGEGPVGDDEDEEEEQDEGQVDQSSRRAPARPPTKRRAERVTEEDLRAMARYMLEKAGEWDPSHGTRKRWAEFAEHPQRKAKRTLMGWYTITHTHGKQLRAHLEKLQAEQNPAGTRTPSTLEPPAHEPFVLSEESPVVKLQLETPSETYGKVKQRSTPLADHKHILPELDTSANTDGRPRKRSAEELALKEESPQRKRPKESTPAEVIVVSD